MNQDPALQQLNQQLARSGYAPIHDYYRYYGPLSDHDRATLETCETTIERGLVQFVQVGKAFAEIRNFRLYREHCTSFEEYCQRRWGLGRNYVNKVIAASTAVTHLETEGTFVPLPENEAPARPLTALNNAPKLQRQAWRTALQTAPDGVVTGEHVKAVVEGIRERLPTKKDVQGADDKHDDKHSIERFKIVDAAGQEAPERVSRWELQQEFKTGQRMTREHLLKLDPREVAEALYESDVKDAGEFAARCQKWVAELLNGLKTRESRNLSD